MVSVKGEDHDRTFKYGHISEDYDLTKISKIVYSSKTEKLYFIKNENDCVGTLLVQSVFSGAPVNVLKAELETLGENWDKLMIELGKISEQEEILSELLKNYK